MRKVLLVVTPLLAMAVLALGMRIGAAPPVRGAIVYGAPRSSARPGLAWQLSTFDEDLGIREAAPIPDLEVIARSGGREARWRGPSNADGIAEVWLDLPAGPGDRVDLSVRDPREKLPLAEGPAVVRTEGPQAPASPWARFARRDGALTVDVVVYGQRLVVGERVTAWVRATDRQSGAPVGGVTFAVDEEQTMSLGVEAQTTSASGWAAVGLTARGHAIALGLTARSPDGRAGTWVGALPVAAGAAAASPPPRIGTRRAATFELRVATIKPVVYAEVRDVHGRVAAATLTPDASGIARFEVPPLPAGRYWLVTSGDPEGGAALGPTALARPFFVEDSDAAAIALGGPECSATGGGLLEPCVALSAGGPFERWVALDGFVGRAAKDRAKRELGVQIALSGLGAAALALVLLVLQGVLEARRALRAAAADGVQPDSRAVTLVKALAGVLLALLGFALIAAVLVRAG